MRFTNTLDNILGQKSKVKALRYLINYKKQVSIRELAREITIAPANLSIILKALEKEGVLTSKKFGKSLVFSLNYNHYLTIDIIIPLFKKEKEAINELKKIILKAINFPFKSIILFGSIKRGEEKPQSDIDLAFIVKDKDVKKINAKVLEINQEVNRIFGNSISPVVIGEKEFIQKAKIKNNFINSLSVEGKVLAGKLISELL